MVHLDLNFLDILRLGSQGNQPDDCGLTDDGGLLEDEVIGRFRLEFPGTGATGCCTKQAVGIAGREGKGADQSDVVTHIPSASLAAFELTNNCVTLLFVIILKFFSNCSAILFLSDTCGKIPSETCKDFVRFLFSGV